MLVACLLFLALPQDTAPVPDLPASPMVRPRAPGGVQAPIVVPTPRAKTPEVPSYKVSLRMKSGRRFSGIVSRDAAFHDLVHAGAHHSVAPYTLDQRFKLHYVDGLDGELELRWSQVAKLEVRDILDSAGLRATESDFASARLRRRERSEPIEPIEPPTPEAGEPSAAPPAVPATDGAKPPPGAARKLSLLSEFPPEQGWTPERKRQIEWRRTVIGTFPDEREQRFLDVYPQWEPLFTAFTDEEQEKAARAAEREKTESHPIVKPVEGKPVTPPANDRASAGSEPPRRS